MATQGESVGPSAHAEAQGRKGRSQHITKLPSSALLGHSVAEAFESYASVASLRVKEGMAAKVLAQIAEAAPKLASAVSWHVMKSPDDGGVWIITETAKPSSTIPTRSSTPGESQSPADEQSPADRLGSGIVNVAKDDVLSGMLNKIQSMLSSPSSITRRRVLVDPPLLPTVLDNTTVEIETIKVKAGEEMDVVDLVRNVFPSCLPKDSTEDIGLELHQDLSDTRLLFLVFHFKSGETCTKLHLSDGWAKWRRVLNPLLDGQSRRQKYGGTYHSNREAAGLTAKPSVATTSLPTTPQAATDKELSASGTGTGVISADPLLRPHAEALHERYSKYTELKQSLAKAPEGHKAGSLVEFSNAYMHFGLRRVEQPQSGWRYREWMPNVKQAFLKGDFNSWSVEAHPLTQDDAAQWGEDVWSVFIADDARGMPLIKHKSKLKIQMETKEGVTVDRVSPWMPLAYHSDSTKLFDGIVWNPPTPYKFKHPRPNVTDGIRIYEAHVGSSSAFEKVATYGDMKRTVLPRIHRLGYNVLLLIGIQEHSYYPSFGWHVTSYFAPSSRCGDPDDFMKLVDEAHRLGIRVVVSMVHSHAAPAVSDGLFHFNGPETSGCYFRQGMWGHQPSWDAQIFDYENPNVLRFLLGNLRWWLDVYNLDGFRFEGVSSMLYHHHGINFEACHEDYSQFFNYDSDEHATNYLMLANEMLHTLLPNVITIASDKSNCPTLCSPVSQGGIGFDYRLGNSHPSAMIQSLLDGDESFSLKQFVDCLETRRPCEKTIACTERYDTCIRGKRPLKIAMFAWESLLTHCVGGVAPHVTELAAALSRLGHEVHVYVRATGSVSSHSVHYGVHYHECTFDLSSDFVGEMINMCNSFAAHMRDTESFMKEKFTICHAHDWLATKTLAHCNSEGRLCIQTMHSTEFGRCGNNAYGGNSKRIRDIEAEGCDIASRVICVSGVLAEEVGSLYGVHPAKIRVIYNGINANQFDGIEDAAAVKASYGIGAMDPLFLFVGRMAVQKGPDLLVEAIPHVLNMRGDAKFIVVGDGHMLDGLNRRVEQLGIGHACKMIGKLGGAPLKSLFKACDAVVVPSRNEPFGIVVLEAWSAYKPVVATTCGGPRDFVSPDIDGFLVDPTPSSISWGCCKILENFDHARWMGTRGRVKAAFSFSWDTIANQSRDCYYEQLARSDASYCEATRGDSTLASRLMGGAIFEHMTIFDQDESVLRGLALHKMMRLIACGLGGEAYMNTMGCEFGQPEFIDLPRLCNNFSYHHARTRWDLADDKQLKFKHFELFDACMIHLENSLKWLQSRHQYVSNCSEEDRVVSFERGDSLFVFNFHPWQSYEGYQVGHSLKAKDMTVALDTDEGRFGGQDRIAHDVPFPDLGAAHNNRDTSIKLYLPSRTAMILVSAARLKTMALPAVLRMSADDYIDLLAPAVPKPVAF